MTAHEMKCEIITKSTFVELQLYREGKKSLSMNNS